MYIYCCNSLKYVINKVYGYCIEKYRIICFIDLMK